MAANRVIDMLANFGRTEYQPPKVPTNNWGPLANHTDKIFPAPKSKKGTKMMEFTKSPFPK